MLYETLSQPLIAVIFAIIGFLSGFIFDIFNFIKFLCGNKKIISHILDFFMTILVFIVFYVLNLSYMYGEIRLFSVVVFLMPFLIERITLGKLLEKFYHACYNVFVKISKRIVGIFQRKQKQKG